MKEKHTYRLAECFVFAFSSFTSTSIEDKLGLRPDERIVSVADLEPLPGRVLFLIERTVRLPASRLLQRRRK